jgi:D-alanine-D-alanine ligase-like ATP-grasp enzyme
MDASSRATIGGNTPKPFSKGSSGDTLIQVLAARRIPYRYLLHDEITHPQLAGRTIVDFRIKDTSYYFDGGCLRVADPHGVRIPGPLIDGRAGLLVKKKDLIGARLRRHGINAPEGTAFDRKSQDEAESFFAKFLPKWPNGGCVKPTDGRQGRYVYVGIRDLSTFRSAFAAVSEHYPRVLVQEAVSGGSYRFLCLGGRVIAIELCPPANVEGDGIHNITELIALKNAQRSLNPTHARHPIQLGPLERVYLKGIGLRPYDTPEAGRVVYLCNFFNWLRGGEIIDATETVHRSYIELVERAIKLVPGLVFCGPDVAIQDASVPATENNYYVLEINCGPGFAAHHRPWRGQSRDVAGALIDYLITRAAGSLSPALQQL